MSFQALSARLRNRPHRRGSVYSLSQISISDPESFSIVLIGAILVRPHRFHSDYAAAADMGKTVSLAATILRS